MLKPARTLTVMNVSQPLVQASLVGEAIDQGPVIVLVADENMSYVAVNQYACDVLGYTRDELLAMKVTDLAPGPETERRYADYLADPHESGRIRVRCKDGTEVELEYTAAKTTVAGMTFYVSVALA